MTRMLLCNGAVGIFKTITYNVCIAATLNFKAKKIKMLQGSQISYRGKNYRVQNANGWQHIIVTEKGERKRIGVSDITKPADNDCVYNYIFEGGFTNYPCPAMEYWIYRHRMGHRITIKEYVAKFNIKIKRV